MNDTAVLKVIARLFLGHPNAAKDPYAHYAFVREQKPVVWMPSRGGPGAWHVTRYDDVAAAFRDKRLSNRLPQVQLKSSESGSEDEQHTDLYFRVLSTAMLTRDPPDHTRLRRLVAKAFTPQTVAKQHDNIQRVTTKLFEKIRKQANVDFMATVAYPLPTTIIAALLGVPEDDWEVFKGWSSGMIAVNDDYRQQAHSNLVNLVNYLQQIADQRREQPKDDLISELLSAQDEQDCLSDDELIAQCVLLLIAGHESTAYALGSAISVINKDRRLLDTVREEPTKLDALVNEIIRLESPFQFAARTATDTLEIAEQTIQPGDRVWLWIGSANHDPRKFERPDEIDLTRLNNRGAVHLAFGGGIHHCLGASLAQLELRSTLQILAERLSDFRLTSEPIEWRTDLAMRGPKELRIALS